MVASNSLALEADWVIQTTVSILPEINGWHIVRKDAGMCMCSNHSNRAHGCRMAEQNQRKRGVYAATKGRAHAPQ